MQSNICTKWVSVTKLDGYIARAMGKNTRVGREVQMSQVDRMFDR